MRGKLVLCAVVSLLLTLLAWWLYVVAAHTTVPRSMKLVDCTNSTLKVHLKVPKGHDYSLVLATPGVGITEELPYKFSGRVQISDGSLTMIEIPIGSDFSVPCNWLPDSTGFILTRGTNCIDLSRFIRPQIDYSIEVLFDLPPPPSTAIWLHWLQAAKDNEKSGQ